MVTAPDCSMLPRVSTSPESRVRVVFMDTLGDPMSRLSADVQFSENEYGRRIKIFHGYEYVPADDTRVIPLQKYFW